MRAEHEAHPAPTPILRGRSHPGDGVLLDIWKGFGLPPARLVAVGGYGREELFPCSDVDLLFCSPDPRRRHLRERLTQMIGLFWDIGLDIGHSVRTMAECIDEAGRDITVQTNLLEARLIGGNARLFASLRDHAAQPVNPGQFFKAKRLEQDQRHTRHDDTPYSSSPTARKARRPARPAADRLDQPRLPASAPTGATSPGATWITPDEATELRELELPAARADPPAP